MGASSFYTKSESLSHEIYFFKMAPQLKVLKQFNIPMGALWIHKSMIQGENMIVKSEINMQVCGIEKRS